MNVIAPAYACAILALAHQFPSIRVASTMNTLNRLYVTTQYANVPAITTPSAPLQNTQTKETKNEAKENPLISKI